MNIEKTKDGENLTLAPAGRLDTNTAPALEDAFNEDADGAGSVVLDMAQLVYLSSAGLRVILSMQKKMNAKGGSMVVKNVNETIMEVFEITGFSDILTIE